MPRIAAVRPPAPTWMFDGPRPAPAPAGHMLRLACRELYRDWRRRKRAWPALKAKLAAGLEAHEAVRAERLAALEPKPAALRVRPLPKARSGSRPLHQPNRPSSSGYRGVTFIASTGRYRAAIWLPGSDATSQHLGSFATADEAARVYDAAAREIYGARAFVNFPN